MTGDDRLSRLLAEHATWLAVERGVAANTLAAYRRDLAGYGAFVWRTGTAPEALGEAHVAAYVEHLRAARDDDGRPRYSASTVARATAAVRSFHRFCADEGLLPDDPAGAVTAPPVPAGIPKALTEAEVDALLGAVTGDGPIPLRDRAILETLYATGLRISELTGADVGDLDLDARLLRAFGKGAKERVVPVGGAAAEAIAGWLPARRHLVVGARRPDPGALFVNARGGRLTRQGCWGIIRRHGVAAGLGGRLSPHVLRHSCATHMVERGADLRVVQDLLGHASVSTTQVYTKVTASRLRAVYEAAHPRARLKGRETPVPRSAVAP